MSKTVDERVVEMRFDNAQFEKNVETSMSTLDKLKKALNLEGASKGLEDVSKATKGIDPSISAISKSVEILEKRFSTMGIVGMEVIRKMTDAALHFATNAMTKVSDAIIGGGMRRAQNIEDARFMLDGLLKDGEKVQAVFDVASESVDGTAFSLDAAAKAAAMFTASGLEAGDETSTLNVAMKALAGTAAMAKGDYEGISDIFTTIAGSGRIMGEELNMFASRGLNVAATLAEYYRNVKGEVNMTEQGIRDLISDKDTNIYFKEFADAMNWAFGDQAKKANETFTGALSNIKSALARTGEKFYAPLIERNGIIVDLFNNVRMRINDINKQLQPFATRFVGVVETIASSLVDFTGSLDSQYRIMEIGEKAYTIFDNIVATLAYTFKYLGQIIKPISQGLSKFIPFDLLDRFKDFTTNIRLAAAGLKLSDDTAKKLRLTFQGVSAVFHMLGTIIGSVAKVISPFSSILKFLGNIFLDITASVGVFLTKLDGIVTKGASAFSGLSKYTNAFADSFKNLITNFTNFRIPFEQFMTESQRNRAYTALTTITNGLSKAFDNLKNVVAGFIDYIRNASPLSVFGNALNTIKTNLTMLGGVLIEGFVRGLEKLASIKFTLPKSFEEIRSVFSKLVATIKTSGSNIKDTLLSVGNNIKNAFIPTDDLIKNASDRYKKITGKIASGLDTKGVIGTVLKAINTGIFGALLIKISEYVRKINKGVGSVKNAFVGVLNQLKKTLEVYQKDLKADILMKIALAILELAAAVKLLSTIPASSLIKACGALAGVATVLGIFFSKINGMASTNALSTVFGKNGTSILSTSSNIVQIGGALITFAAAITILSFALKNFEDMDFKQVMRGLLGIMGIAMTLTKTVEALVKKCGKDLERNAKDLVIVGVSMMLIAEAVKILTKPLVEIGQMETGQALQGLGAVIAMIKVLTRSLKSLEKVNPASMMASGAAMMEIALAMTMLIAPIAILGLIPFPVVAQGLGAVAVGMLSMAGALKIASSDFGKVTTSAGKLLAAGAAMMMIAAAMNELMVPIIILGAIPWDTLKQGMKAVAGGLAAMTISLKILSSAGASNSLGAGGGMMMIAAAMNMLLPVILIMGTVPWQIIAQGLLLFSGGLLALALIGKVATAGAAGLMALGSSLLMISGAFLIFNAGLALFGVAVASIAAGLTALSALSSVAAQNIVNAIKIIVGGILTMVPELGAKLLQAIVTLVDVALEGLIESTPKIMDFINTFLVEAIATFVSVQGAAVEGVLLLVEAILTSLAEHAPGIIDKLLTFIIGLIDGLAAKIPSLFSSIANLVGVIVDTILSGIKNLEGSSISDIIEFGGILATFMTAMAGLSLLAAPAMVGVLAFGGLIAEMSIVLAAVGALNSIPGLQQFADKGGDLLQSVGTAIGKFVGGFVGGALEGIAATLPKIGTDLSSFMMTIQPFISGVNNIDDKAVAGCTALAGMIIALTGTSVIAGIGLFAGGAIGFVTIGLELKAFGPMIADFAKSVEGINPAAVNAAANAGRMIIELVNNLPKSGGLADLFGKSMDMQEFGRQLDWFGYYIVLFSQRVDGNVSEAAVQAAVNAGKMISEMAKTIHNSGGVLGAFLGNNDMQEFGRQLDWFGYYMVSFSKRVDGKISEAAVQASANAGKIITDLAKSIPNSGPSVVSFFVGDNDMQTFGRQLDWFGYYLASYSNRVANLSLDGIANSKEAALNLISMATEMETSAKSIRAIVGASLLSAFGLELELFGGSISNYSNAISGISLPAMQGTVIEVKKLVDLANDIAAIDTSVYSNFSNSLTTMAKNGISSFVGAFTNSTSQVQTAVYSLITNAINLVNTQMTPLYNAGLRAGQQVDNGMIAGMNGFLHNVLTTAVKVCTDFINVFNTKIVQKIWFDLAQINVMQSLINGMNTKKPMLISAATIICTSLIDVFKKYLLVATFTAFGSNNVIQSLINGMRNKAPELNKVAKEICDDLVKIFKEGLDPKKFSEIGEKALKGLIDSFNSESAKQKLREAVKSICDLIVKTFNELTTGDSSPFVEVGKQISAGLAKGIIDSKGQVSEAIKKVIKEAVESAKKESDEHSPSKVFATIGKFFDLGLAQGINNNTSSVTGATANLAKSTIDAMRSAISRVTDMASDELDFQPTITPVIDLTNIQNGSKKLRGIITKGLNTSIAYDNALMSSPNMRISAMTSVPDDAMESGSVVSNNYNFTQNNYSPKALSRKEIYRQTRNQFSALKGAVNRA